MRKRNETTVNLVRENDSDTYEVVSDFDLTLMRGRYKIVPEKARFDEKRNQHGRFYIRLPKT